LKSSEKVAVKYSHAEITDNQAIKDYTLAEYGSVSHLIEYGGDHAMPVKLDSKYIAKYKFLNTAYAFKVARIEPENNVHVILNAFTKTTNNLVVVGNWNNSPYGQELKKFYSSFTNIFLLDPIYNQEELDTLRQGCALYVHGHSAGGTNPSLVEAMHLGLPILAYDVSYNKETTENQAFYFSDDSDLAEKILDLDHKELVKNGNRMEAIAKRRYTWSVIAEKYKGLIYTVEQKVSKPTAIPKTPLMNRVNESSDHIAQYSTMNYFKQEQL
jgi:glycosyltransferase involved in cell wall biosynthesis